MSAALDAGTLTSHRREATTMTEQEVRELVSEVVVLRNNPQWRAEDNELIASGAALSSQVGREDIRERSEELRALSPGT